MTARVVHLVQRLSAGGAGRALLNLAGTGVCGEHRVVSLDTAAVGMSALARHSGLEVIEAPGAARLQAELEAADVVHVHFWNTPELYEVLTGELPDTRLLVWVHVGGAHPPHVLSHKLISLSDMTVCASPYTMALPCVRDGDARMIPPAAGWGRLDGIETKPNATFNVGYIGTVDFIKMHPRYVELSARVDVPAPRFIVCGGGGAYSALRRQAEALGAADRFDLRGHVSDVASVIAELDVFGYPLCEDNYSAAELVLQEVMYAGIPAVVMPYGGAQCCVAHGHTGLVARDEDDYVHAIECLYAHPEERRRLGHAAREHAIRSWSPGPLEAQWKEAYEELLAQPKRVRSWERDSELDALATRAPGAALFVDSLGEQGTEFRTSLVGAGLDEVLAAEAALAASTPGTASAGGGGILHYRRRYPDDSQLRLWSGLVLLRQGHPAVAAAEFVAAIELGFEHWRASLYLAQAGEALGQRQLIAEAMSRVPRRERGRQLEATCRPR